MRLKHLASEIVSKPHMHDRLTLHSRPGLNSSEEFRQDSARSGVAYRNRNARVSGP